MKPIIFVMCGLPCSGKSVEAQKIAKEYNAEIFSSDFLREEMFGDINDQSHNQELFKELHKRIRNCLISRKNACYDACNISYKRRMEFLKSLNKISCNKIAVLMATPYEVCLERNSKRDRKVPEFVIKRMYMNFQCPYYFEGWNEIKIIYKDSMSKPHFNRGSFESMAINYMKNFNQNNPHHIYDVYDHSKAIMFQYQQGDIRRVAAMLHDCMKKKVQTTDKDGVSHYFHHENISAYYVLTHPNIVNCETYDEMLKIIFYITYHMIAHNIKSSKSIEKYKNIFGISLYESIMDFAEKDRIASNVAIFNKNKNNIYIKKDDYTIGYTRLGDMFLIDTEDVNLVSQYTWCIKNKAKKDYRLVSLSDGKMKFMHRLIMRLEDPSIIVDHINHKQFDNRKAELRICSSVENSYNTSLSKNNTSGKNGVSRMNNGKYRAYIFQNYKQIYLGVYDTLEEASAVRDRASILLYGEFANISV